MEVFDAHQHVGQLAHWLEGSKSGEKTASPEEMMEADIAVRLKVMADNGIDKAIVMPTFGYPQPDGIKDTQKVNNAIAAFRDRDPARFPIALGIVEPAHGERGLDEIDRIKNELKLQGIVWHHRFHGHYIDSPIMRPFLRRVSDLDLIPFIHTFDGVLEAPWRLEVLAEEFSNLIFVNLDPFSEFERSQEVFQIARRNENILFDTALAFAPHWLIERFIESLGSERLLFGSDLHSPPLSFNICTVLEDIRRANISEQDKNNILGGNLKRLFNLT